MLHRIFFFVEFFFFLSPELLCIFMHIYITTKQIQGIKHLSNLKIFDISENIISAFDIKEIPEGVEYLYLHYNPFFDELDLVKYRFDCINYFNNLVILDSKEVKDKEKLLFYGRKNYEKHKSAFMKKIGMEIIMHYDKIKSENDKIVEEVKNEETNVENFDFQMSNETENKEKELLANMFVSTCKDLLTQYHTKIDKIKETFPRNSDFSNILEASKLDLLKLKYKFEEFVNGRAGKLGERINEKLDADNKISIAEEKIQQIEKDVLLKEKLIDHNRIKSEIRQEMFEVKEENKEEEGALSEEDKEEENVKEDN